MPETTEITFPVQLHEHIPDVSPGDALNMLREMADILQAQKGPKPGLMRAEVMAAKMIIGWYEDAEASLPLIRAMGLAKFISSRHQPMVWATLEGLKAKGHKRITL